MNKKLKLELFLKNYWKSSKIKSGDTILLHSNATRLVKNCFKIDPKFKSELKCCPENIPLKNIKLL